MTAPHHITLRTRALLRLDNKASSDRWHNLFLEAGLLTTVPAELAPGSPLALLKDTRERLLNLQAQEVRLHEARAPVGGFGNHAPIWAWLAVLLVPLLSWQLTSLGETEEEMLMAFGWGIYTSGAIAALILAWVLHLELKARKARAERIAALEASVPPLAESLPAAARAALSRSFVARAGPRLVVSTPHLGWLQACVATVRRAMTGRPGAGAELEGFVAELEAEVGRVQAAQQALLMEPPARWSDSGLVPKLGPYRRRLASLGLAPDPLCAALDEAWGIPRS